MEITGDAKLHYQGATLATQQRDTHRFVEIALLGTPDGKANFEKVMGKPSRYALLTGPLLSAATLLGTILREGVLWRAADDDDWQQRDGLEVCCCIVCSHLCMCMSVHACAYICVMCARTGSLRADRGDAWQERH